MVGLLIMCTHLKGVPLSLVILPRKSDLSKSYVTIYTGISLEHSRVEISSLSSPQGDLFSEVLKASLLK